MVSGPTSAINTPVMHFRPDPGEPAANLSATEPQSAGLVTAQERRNETRLRMRAMASGDDVLYSNRTYTLGLGTLSPTFNGGLTTVVSRTDSNGFLPDQVYQPQGVDREDLAAAEETDDPEEEDQAASGSAGDIQSAAQPAEEEIDREEQTAETEGRQLERNLLRAQLEKERAFQNGNTAEALQADREEANLERKMQENEEDQREIEQERFAQQLEEFQQASNQVISENVSAAARFLDVFFGGGEYNTQNQPARPSTPDVPRFSFARAR